MYYHMEAIKDVSENVLKPVAEQVVRYIISEIGFSNIFDKNIYFEGDSETTSNSLDEDNNRKLYANKLICNVSNILSPSETPWDSYNNTYITSEGFPRKRLEERYPNFSDIINKLFLFTMDRPAAINIECNFHFEDRTIAYEIGNRLFSQFQHGGTVPVMDILFEYPIPERMLTNLFIMYQMTEFSKNPANKFISYLKDGSNNAITVKVNKFKQSVGQVVIQKTHHYCLVKIDYSTQTPEAEKKNKLPIKFNDRMTLTIQFMKPDDMIMQFPLIINNQLVPGNLIPPHDIPPQPPWVDNPMIASDKYNKQVVKDKNAWIYADNNHIVRVPFYDKWLPPGYPRFPANNYKPIVIICFPITIGEPWETWLHLVNDIQAATGVADEIITFIKYNDPEIFFPGLPILVSVYRDDELLDQSCLRIEGDYLVIKTNKVNRIHRVVIFSEVKRIADRLTPIHTLTCFDIITSKEGK